MTNAEVIKELKAAVAEIDIRIRELRREKNRLGEPLETYADRLDQAYTLEIKLVNQRARIWQVIDLREFKQDHVPALGEERRRALKDGLKAVSAAIACSQAFETMLEQVAMVVEGAQAIVTSAWPDP